MIDLRNQPWRNLISCTTGNSIIENQIFNLQHTVPKKSPQKVWNILETTYFWSYLEMRCTVFIILGSVFFLLYNAALFLIIANFTAEILPLGGGRVRKKCAKIWGQQHKSHWKKHHYSAKSIWDPR